MRENVSSILVDVEGADLEDHLDEAMNEGDDKVDGGQAREGETIPLGIERKFDLSCYLRGWQDVPQA